MFPNKYSESLLTDVPEYLKSINKPPHLLHYRGDISLIHESKRVAVVGTRTPSTFGIEECRFITTWFVENGYTIISGLARGTDSIAHQTCIETGGKTIAVLPSGLENIYPPENQTLAERIVESGGLLITEYPDHSSPRKQYFIQRDRLQSGLSLGVVIIESEQKSGTMHTARFTIQQKRVLGCVEYDHGLDIPQTSGNTKLIKAGQAFGLNRDNLLVFEGMLREKLHSHKMS
ncbi:MAG: DNA-processing protein DprA [Bacteroidota bacterium]